MEFVFPFVNKILHYKEAYKAAGHPDSNEADNGQKCTHCKFDPRADWNPQASHQHKHRLRRDEPKNGFKHKSTFALPTENGIAEVHREFWRNTFGI
jgi:hypothetical protein